MGKVQHVLGPVVGHTAGLARVEFLDMPEQSPLYCGVILAGGKGTRMGALTKVTNKHLLPVGKEPMIYHPLRKLTGAGVNDILVVTGTEHMGDFVNLLGSGHDWRCGLTYRVQDTAGGIAQALGLAEGFCCGNGRPVVLLGDNIFEDSLVKMLGFMRNLTDRACVVLKAVADPQRYGVAEFSHDHERIKSIEEKPIAPRSNFAVCGIYVYPHDVFDVIRTLRPSARGELEITDVNNYYLSQNRLNYHILDGYWTDAGTLPSWAEANQLVLNQPPKF